MNIGKLIVVSLVVWLLNEFLFYSFIVGAGISAVLLAVVLVLLARMDFRRATLVTLVVSLCFYTRPRELHLIELATRGAWDYYSPNTYQVAGFTVSTWLMLLVSSYALLHVLKSRNATSLLPGLVQITVLPLLVGLLATMLSVLHGSFFSFAWLVTDAKVFVLFSLGGSALIAFRSANASFDWLLSAVVICGIVVGCVTVLCLVQDLLIGESKLRYNSNVFVSALAGFLMIRQGVNRFGWQLIGVLLLVVSFPLTRGEQLIYAFIVMAAATSLIKPHGQSGRLKRFGLVAMMFILPVILAVSLSARLPQTARFFSEKVEQFGTYEVVDKSTRVRLAEMAAVFSIDGPRDVVRFVIGSGLGVGMPIKTDMTSHVQLNLSDYSKEELYLWVFRQPHTFFTYWVMKVGALGVLVFALLIVLLLKRAPRSALVLSLVILLPLLWQSYWVPVWGWMAGMLFMSLRLSANRGGTRDGLRRTV